MSFDYAKYAKENGVAIAIDPFTDSGVKVYVSPAVEAGETYINLECCEHDTIIPGHEQIILDAAVARIGRRDARHLGNIYSSRSREEREKFFRDGNDIY